MTTESSTAASSTEVERRTPRAALLGNSFVLLPYLLAGTLFGILLVKSEVASWFRIQEMVRFQSVHMYGVMGSAVITAYLSLRLLKWYGVRTVAGDEIRVPPKELGRGHRYWIGGAMFGVGWALTGTCPGPLFALIGSGETVFVVTMVAALAGTWSYAHVRSRIPH